MPQSVIPRAARSSKYTAWCARWNPPTPMWTTAGVSRFRSYVGTVTVGGRWSTVSWVRTVVPVVEVAEEDPDVVTGMPFWRRVRCGGSPRGRRTGCRRPLLDPSLTLVRTVSAERPWFRVGGGDLW